MIFHGFKRRAWLARGATLEPVGAKAKKRKRKALKNNADPSKNNAAIDRLKNKAIDILKNKVVGQSKNNVVVSLSKNNDDRLVPQLNVFPHPAPMS